MDPLTHNIPPIPLHQKWFLLPSFWCLFLPLPAAILSANQSYREQQFQPTGPRFALCVCMRACQLPLVHWFVSPAAAMLVLTFWQKYWITWLAQALPPGPVQVNIPTACVHRPVVWACLHASMWAGVDNTDCSKDCWQGFNLSRSALLFSCSSGFHATSLCNAICRSKLVHDVLTEANGLNEWWTWLWND